MPIETHDAKLVREYRLDPSRFHRRHNRMLVAICAIVPITIAAQWYTEGHFRARHDIVGVLVAALVAAISARRDVGKEKRRWESFVIELRTDRLVRTMEGFSPLEIAPSEVTAIIESSGGLAIRTNSRAKTLGISSTLLDYEDLRARLKTWAPVGVTEHRSVFSTALTILLCLGFVAIAFGIPVFVIQTSHREWVIPLSSLSFTTLLVAILYFRNSPYWPTSARWSAWILLLIPLGAMASRLMQ